MDQEKIHQCVRMEPVQKMSHVDFHKALDGDFKILEFRTEMTSTPAASRTQAVGHQDAHLGPLFKTPLNLIPEHQDLELTKQPLPMLSLQCDSALEISNFQSDSSHDSGSSNNEPHMTQSFHQFHSKFMSRLSGSNFSSGYHSDFTSAVETPEVTRPETQVPKHNLGNVLPLPMLSSTPVFHSECIPEELLHLSPPVSPLPLEQLDDIPLESHSHNVPEDNDTVSEMMSVTSISDGVSSVSPSARLCDMPMELSHEAAAGSDNIFNSVEDIPTCEIAMQLSEPESSPHKTLAPALKLPPSIISSCTNKAHFFSKGLIPTREQFKQMFLPFSPIVPDRLIGRRVGLDKVDIVEELYSISLPVVIARLLGHMTADDLIKMCLVSKTWQRVVHSNKDAFVRKSAFVLQLEKQNMTQKENFVLKNTEKLIRGLTEANTPLQTLQSVQLTVKPETRDVRPKEGSHQRFWKIASELRNDESLRKCPRCSQPAKFDKTMERAVCCNEQCQFAYCSKCLHPFHGPSTCMNSPRKRICITAPVGSRKSKRNLKRL